MSDKNWAFWIGKELEALGHTPRLHDWDIKGGDDIMAWMVERHDKADFILGVVSDEWLRAAYSKVERMAGEWAAAKKHPGFMLYVVVQPATHCRPSAIIASESKFLGFRTRKRQRLEDYVANATCPPIPDASPDPV